MFFPYVKVFYVHFICWQIFRLPLDGSHVVPGSCITKAVCNDTHHHHPDSPMYQPAIVESASLIITPTIHHSSPGGCHHQKTYCCDISQCYCVTPSPALCLPSTANVCPMPVWSLRPVLVLPNWVNGFDSLCIVPMSCMQSIRATMTCSCIQAD
jgi:hypothetical protein